MGGSAMSRTALCLLLASTLVVGTIALSPSSQDLHRAKTKIPRDTFKGPGQEGLSKVLNTHLVASEGNTKPCDQWTPRELQEFMAIINGARHPELQKIYQRTNDRRQVLLNETSDFQTHWDELNRIAAKQPHLIAPLRDTHCREAVMWWTHHLTDAMRNELRALSIVVPLLPEKEREPCGGVTRDADEKHLCVS